MIGLPGDKVQVKDGVLRINGNPVELYMLLLFGIAGYVFRKIDIPVAPLVLALVLGDAAESSFRQSMLISQGSLAVFWSNWLVGSLTTLALVLLVWPLVTALRERFRGTSP